MNHDLADTRAALARAQTNAKHTKSRRQLHDKVEAAQFAAIAARDRALDAAKVADTTAEHLAHLLEDEA